MFVSEMCALPAWLPSSLVSVCRWPTTTGWALWSEPYKITFTIKPMYENSQQPEKFTLTFHRGGKEDRDGFFGEMARVLRAKPWQPAAVVNAPVAAPEIAAHATPVAAVAQPEAERAAADADGIFVNLPCYADRSLAGRAAESVKPVCPPRCGFEYNFGLERTYTGR